MLSNMLRIFTDGSGKTGKYIYVVEDTNEVKIFQKKGITNNIAEYLAVVEALKAFPKEDVEIISDSELMVNQLQMKYSIKNDELRKLAEEVWNLSKGRKVSFVNVPREKNKAGKILG